MNSDIPCRLWEGAAKLYQTKAAEALYVDGWQITPWSWLMPTCGENFCIEPQHLKVHQAKHLAYPYGICVYCGRHAGTMDHLLPRAWSGDISRSFVVKIPACGTCNSVLGTVLTWSITERRAICHARLRRHFRRVMKCVDFTDEELDEFGPVLRAFIVNEMDKKREVERMLEWPTDPHYDLRALEKSGIENPWATGLLITDEAILAEIVRAVA